MAIEGLTRVQPPVNTGEARPQIDPGDEIGVAVERLVLLGLVGDVNREQVTESVMADFKALDKSGETGVKYIWLPPGLIALPEVIGVLHTSTYPSGREYSKAHVDHKVWTPGTHSYSYEAIDIGNLELGRQGVVLPAHARLAVYNSDGDHDPLLHFTGQPFDAFHAKDGEETQLEAIARAAQAYKAAHEGFAMTPLDSQAVASIEFERRIRGDEEMVLQDGVLRDATLPVREVVGTTFVGSVDSDGNQMRFDRSFNGAYTLHGVGLSVAPEL